MIGGNRSYKETDRFIADMMVDEREQYVKSVHAEEPGPVHTSNAKLTPSADF